MDAFRSRLPAMLDELAELVRVESPSSDLEALARCAAVVEELGVAHLGAAPERIDRDGRTHFRWCFGDGPPVVVLVGHYDTVHPLGSIDEWPFTVEDGRATGPGVFDMKAGVVQAFHALGVLAGGGGLDGVALVLDSDEELGSPTSRDLVEATVEGAAAALILEPSGPGGALKTARKGVSMYTIEVRGRAAHAGLEPHLGVNALVELAHQVLAVDGLDDPDLGTTVTPTVATAGTTTNTVPAGGSVRVDVRASTVDEQHRVDAAIRALRPHDPRAAVEVLGGPNRPPLEPAASAGLFALAQQVAEELGLAPLEGVHVGGGSDGNFTAALGIPTLDGLGAVGGGAHARTEHVDVEAMADRAALLAGLVAAVRSRGRGAI